MNMNANLFKPSEKNNENSNHILILNDYRQLLEKNSIQENNSKLPIF